jgi:hypothetical protein
METTYLYSFIAAGALLLLIDIIFFVFISGIRKKNKILFAGKKGENLEDAFLGQVQKNKDQDSELKEILKRVKDLERISEKTFQKFGIVRFNTFPGMGGNQSFAIALLDSKDNGFIISSLLIKESNRVFAKSVKNGQPEYSLSNEEKEALEKAINFKI